MQGLLLMISIKKKELWCINTDIVTFSHAKLFAPLKGISLQLRIL